jgi:hypothetical protein
LMLLFVITKPMIHLSTTRASIYKKK